MKVLTEAAATGLVRYGGAAVVSYLNEVGKAISLLDFDNQTNPIEPHDTLQNCHSALLA